MIPNQDYPGRLPVGSKVILQNVDDDVNGVEVVIVSHNGNDEYPYVVQPRSKQARKALKVLHLFVADDEVEAVQ